MIVTAWTQLHSSSPPQTYRDFATFGLMIAENPPFRVIFGSSIIREFV